MEIFNMVLLILFFLHKLTSFYVYGPQFITLFNIVYTFLPVPDMGLFDQVDFYLMFKIQAVIWQ